MQLKAIMKKLAKENQISAQLVLQNYMLERFLERVSLSPYRDNYIIKGGFLISSMVGLNSRATMDMDATIKGYPVTQDAVQKMIEQILTVPVDDDITFTFKSIGEIREGDEYTVPRSFDSRFSAYGSSLKAGHYYWQIKSHHAKFNMTTS